MIEQPETVAGRIPIRERLQIELGLAEPTLVPGDDAELRRQRLHLRREHLAIHQEAVRQNQRRPIPTAVIEAQPLAVYLREGHVYPGGDSISSPALWPSRPSRLGTAVAAPGRGSSAARGTPR